MSVLEAAEVPTCDSLYVAAHRDDVALSCAGRLLWEARQGLRILVVTLFGPGLEGPFAREEEAAEQRTRALLRLGVLHLTAGLPEARRRSSRYSGFTSITEDRDPADQPWLERAEELLARLAHRTRARQAYAPLAVGGHIDRRLAHEAARAAFSNGHGRNVFLYEERPDALVRGAVRLRLAQMGARLPPAAAEAARRSAVAPYLMRYHLGPAFRGDLGGFWERVRAARPAARQLRASRSWHPLRSFGPRLQPVVHPSEAGDLAAVRELVGPWGASVQRLARKYASALGGGEHAERYWLILPPRQTDGVEELVAAAGSEARPGVPPTGDGEQPPRAQSQSALFASVPQRSGS